MLQLRNQQGQAYRVDRDLVNLFQLIARRAAYSLAREGWGVGLRDYAAKSGLDAAALAPAGTALAKFLAVANGGDSVDFPAALAASGLDRLPPPVQVALFTQIGLSTLVYYYGLTREANPQGYAPPGTNLLGEVAEQTADALRQPTARQRQRRASQIAERKVRDQPLS